MNKILIFDTTLRDGEQAPGAALNQNEKVEIARALALLGVDIIEAGFPVSSPGDFASVQAVSRAVKGAVICGLARAVEKDIDAAVKALAPAKRSRVHVVLATSKIHMRYKLKKAEDEILRLAVASVKYARRRCADVEFSAEDASRSDPDFLRKIIEAVIGAGARTVNIPDTVGYTQPDEFGRLIRLIGDTVPNISKAVISVHCHDDLGMGVANSLAAIKNGARQVECTINGIGERAGNAAMEEIVMNLDTRKDSFAGVTTGIKKQHIYMVSRLVSKLTGLVIAPNKAVMGGNAFRHESGIHQDGVLKERSTYEIIRPEDVGFTGEGIVLGKHSGRHAVASRLATLGIQLSVKQFENAFIRFKELADKKKEVFDDDLRSIVGDTPDRAPMWALERFEVHSGTRILPQAIVSLRKNKKVISATSSGDGPVDACCKAIEKITGIKAELLDYRLEAVTKGEDAVGEVHVRVRFGKHIILARASSTDVVEASVLAYLSAVNKHVGSTK